MGATVVAVLHGSGGSGRLDRLSVCNGSGFNRRDRDEKEKTCGCLTMENQVLVYIR
jgi:hypothetical protein